MEMRTRIFGKMLNDEIEAYLSRNDIIIVPVGTTEMHGGFPVDVETVAGEAIALKMAESCDGLVLTNLPYFYAGATVIGKGTVQVSVQEGNAYLKALARNLLRLGFKRQIYISFHGPAHLTIAPMVRDFYDETGVPILYMDIANQMMTKARDLFNTDAMFTNRKLFMDTADSVFIGAYQIMNRLEDIPLTTKYEHMEPQTTQRFHNVLNVAYLGSSAGFCYGQPKDHNSTVALPDAQTRKRFADQGQAIIEELVGRMEMPKIVAQLRELEQYGHEIEEKYPWIPSAWNKDN